MTGRKLISDTLKLIEATSAGEDPEPEESEDALDRLNEMIDTWAAQRLTSHAITRLLYTLTSGQQQYELGPTAADFVQARPTHLDRMGLIQNNNPVQPIEHEIQILTTQDWAQDVPVKNVDSALPTKAYITWTHPNLLIDLWPLPSRAGLQLVVYHEVNLIPWPNLDTDLQFPPGYAEALRYNLGVRLCPEFGRQPSQVLVANADRTFGIIKAGNLAQHQSTLGMDEALLRPGRHFDWRTGDPQGRQ